MFKSTYRADIDGLRAVAVLSVILFHLQVTGFTGGYVGVDIFFVISGYLITSLINVEIQRGQFSLSGFYVRRIRRLAPALLAMLIPVSVAAYIILKPEDLRSYGVSLGLQFASLQNVHFLSEGEYFHNAEMKPLLHTWSLAVEEQFYLFWPLTLLFLTRFSFSVRIVLTVALILGSFALNLALMNISPKASFFLLPPRAWELGIGCMVALLEINGNLRLDRKVRTWFSIIGCLAILFSVLKFTAETSFPGISALLPVMGACFLLLSGIGSFTFVGRLFAHPLMVRIGLISYPLYLWHWPVTSLLRQLKIDPTQPVYVVAILILTICLAEITYRYIELPIRSRKWLPSTKSLLVAIGFSFVVGAASGFYLWITNGAAYRYSPMARSLLTAPMFSRSDRCGFLFKATHPREHVCSLHIAPSTNHRVLLWGNSHADMWSGMLRELAEKESATLYLNARNCRATIDSDFCGDKVQQSILDKIKAKRITDVVLASTWHDSYRISDQIFEREFIDLIKKLAVIGVKIWIVIDVPSDPSLDPLFAYELNPDDPSFGVLSLDEYQRQRQRQLSLFLPIAETFSNVRLIDPIISLCDSAGCSGGRGETPWYRDRDHLTDAGAAVASSQFSTIFRMVDSSSKRNALE